MVGEGRQDGGGVRPRLCHVTKWEDFDGYGFNLHAERNKPGQYIGKVDPESPAEAAGLKEGDKIIEVNGVNISQENHKQVVQRIKTDPTETKLLVVDSETEAYFKEKNIIITGQLSSVLFQTSDKDFEHIDTRIQEPTRGRDSPDSDVSLEDTSSKHSVHRVDSHASVGRQDSLISERTLSNRSSVSSGKDKEKKEEYKVVVTEQVPEDEHSEHHEHHEDVEVKGALKEDASSDGEADKDGMNNKDDSDHEKDEKTKDEHAAGMDSLPDAPVSPSSIKYMDDNESSSSEDEEEEEEKKESKHVEDGLEAKDKDAQVHPAAPKSVVFENQADAPEVEAAPLAVFAQASSPPAAEVEAVLAHAAAPEAAVAQAVVPPAAEFKAVQGPNSISSGSPRSTPSPVNRGSELKDGGLDLPLTAREMRERIVSKKKKDPRRDDRMDFRKKYEIIQTL